MNKPSLNTLLQKFEAEQIQRKLPDFGPGDTVVVNVKVKEGNRERVQAYEGVVIGKKNAGLNSAFTVRKISHGFGVERVFQTHSAAIDSVDSEAPRRRPRGQAVLPAWPGRQGGAHQGRPRRQREGQGRRGRCCRRAEVSFRTRCTERPPKGGRLRFRASQRLSLRTTPVSDNSTHDRTPSRHRSPTRRPHRRLAVGRALLQDAQPGQAGDRNRQGRDRRAARESLAASARR